MTLPTPNLDDRDFDQLLAEALRRMKQSGTDWNDLSANDPGIVLLDLFAYLTETTIYRLNRLPEKAYIEFLNYREIRALRIYEGTTEIQRVVIATRMLERERMRQAARQPGA